MDASRLTWAPPKTAADGREPWLPLDWLGQAGSEVAVPLTGAIGRVQTLAADGRIDRAEALRLQGELARVRRTAIVAQQLARLSTGAVRQSPERFDLAEAVRTVIAGRQVEDAASGAPATVCQPAPLHPVIVLADPALVVQFLETMLDWSLDHAGSALRLTLEPAAGSRRARLQVCADAAARAAPDAGARSAERVPDTLAWQLLQQLAALLGATLERSARIDDLRLSVDFAQASAAPVAAGRRGAGGSSHAKPLLGHHVLVVSSNRDLRHDVRDAVRHLGLMVDFVASVDDARAFCREGLPHAIVADARGGRDRLRALQRELRVEAPGLTVIEVTEDGNGHSTSDDTTDRLARVGRAGLVDGLPAVLVYELTRGA